MAARSRYLAVAVAFVLLTAGVVVVQSGLLATVDPPDDADYDRTTVVLVDASGERLAEVDVRIADTPEKRYLGLSNTESLGPREGMLFVHDEEGQYAYVMRDMAFPLDIVFVSAEGTVTTIHHATLPPDGTSESDLTRYRGRGRYVLELPLGTANETGLDEGDRVVVPGSTDVDPGTDSDDSAVVDATDATEASPSRSGSTVSRDRTPTVAPTAGPTSTSTAAPGFGWVATLAALVALAAVVATVASVGSSARRRRS
jgi:hypothetical protein